jgi:hypothetical protein
VVVVLDLLAQLIDQVAVRDGNRVGGGSILEEVACLCGREDTCRLQARLQAHVTIVAEGAAELTWIWEVADTVDVVIGVVDGLKGDECACLLSYARLSVLDLLAGQKGAPSRDTISLAITRALGAERAAVVAVRSPFRPKWI